MSSAPTPSSPAATQGRGESLRPDGGDCRGRWYRRYRQWTCGGTLEADVQALLPTPISAASGDGIYDCIYRLADGISLTVTIYPSDADKSSYTTLAGNADHQVTAVGDMAY